MACLHSYLAICFLTHIISPSSLLAHSSRGLLLQVSLYDVKAECPCVRQIPIPPSSSQDQGKGQKQSLLAVSLAEVGCVVSHFFLCRPFMSARSVAVAVVCLPAHTDSCAA